MIRPIKPILFASLTLTFLASAAHSEGSAAKLRPVARVHVAYPDLDIEKETDARVMLDRLKRAAYVACGGNPRAHHAYDVMPHHTVEIFRECRENAISTAVAEINSPTLTRIARMGGQ
jgi:UrcA family protein